MEAIYLVYLVHPGLEPGLSLVRASGLLAIDCRFELHIPNKSIRPCLSPIEVVDIMVKHFGFEPKLNRVWADFLYQLG